MARKLSNVQRQARSAKAASTRARNKAARQTQAKFIPWDANDNDTFAQPCCDDAHEECQFSPADDIVVTLQEQHIIDAHLPVEQTYIFEPERRIEFVLFPKLPYEIRIRIWRFAANTNPRTVRLNIQNTFLSDPILHSKLWSRAPPSPIPYVSYEARKECGLQQLHFFDPLFGSRYLWFNNNIDTLELGRGFFDLDFIRKQPDLLSVRRMAINLFFFLEQLDVKAIINAGRNNSLEKKGYRHCLSPLLNFPALEEFTLLSDYHLRTNDKDWISFHYKGEGRPPHTRDMCCKLIQVFHELNDVATIRQCSNGGPTPMTMAFRQYLHRLQIDSHRHNDADSVDESE